MNPLLSQITRYKAFLSADGIQIPPEARKRLNDYIRDLEQRILDINRGAKVKVTTIEVESALYYLDLEPENLTPNEIIKEAIRRGFRDGVDFTSATGLKNCIVKGSLFVKQPRQVNGFSDQFINDLVHDGIGCIRCGQTGKWGKIVKN